MKKVSLKKEMKKWLRFWYLGGWSSYMRSRLHPETKNYERKIYRKIQDVINS